MKIIRSSVLCFVVLFVTPPLLRAQDLSKYRHFSLGTSLTRVLERTDQKAADVKVVHRHPALIQELTWWPPHLPGTSFRQDTVQEILFSFIDGELYRISVTYDRGATEGLTAEDMVQSISAKYGTPIKFATKINFPTHGNVDFEQEIIAGWEDSQYSFNLVRAYFSNRFQLVIYSKRRNADADEASTEAAKLEEQEGPQREAERQKKEIDDLEAARQKNRKIFHP